MRHTILSRHLPIPLYRATPDGQEADNDDHVAKYAVISSSAITAHRLSFFSLCISLPLSWSSAGSDLYGCYPVNTDKKPTFLIGLTLSFVWVTLMGVSLGAGVISNPAFATAYNTSSGTLILGGFGKFCGVIVALGVISNNIPGTYATAPRYQVLGRFGKAIPVFGFASSSPFTSSVLSLAAIISSTFSRNSSLSWATGFWSSSPLYWRSN